MNQTKNRAKGNSIQVGLGWSFTEQEERLMAHNCKCANDFMQKYGKGKKPFKIDKSHYEPGVTEETAPTKNKSK